MKHFKNLLALALLLVIVGGCKKTEETPAPENLFLQMLGKWQYISTYNAVSGEKIVEHSNLVVEFLKNYTFNHYTNGKLSRTGKYKLLESLEEQDDSNYGTTTFRQLQYLDTNEILIFEAGTGYNSTTRVYFNVFSIPKGKKGTRRFVVESYQEIK